MSMKLTPQVARCGHCVNASTRHPQVSDRGPSDAAAGRPPCRRPQSVPSLLLASRGSSTSWTRYPRRYPAGLARSPERAGSRTCCGHRSRARRVSLIGWCCRARLHRLDGARGALAHRDREPYPRSRRSAAPEPASSYSRTSTPGWTTRRLVHALRELGQTLKSSLHDRHGPRSSAPAAVELEKEIAVLDRPAPTFAGSRISSATSSVSCGKSPDASRWTSSARKASS